MLSGFTFKVLGITSIQQRCSNNSHQHIFVASAVNRVFEYVNIFTKILTLFVKENNVNTRRI